jgi:hypothetical protein
MRISTQGTTLQGLKMLKEGFFMTWPSIQKILEDHDMLPQGVNNYIYNNICKIGK